MPSKAELTFYKTLGRVENEILEFYNELWKLISGIDLSKAVVKRVRVADTPIGPAPEHVRNAWKGVEFIGIKLPDVNETEVDFVTGEPAALGRQTYVVYAPYAIDKLRESSPEAADWFTQNLSKDHKMLSFGVDEVEVVSPSTS